MKIIPVLLGGTGVASHPDGSLVSSSVMRNVKYTAQYLSTPTQQACDAKMNFTKTPSASTAMEYALSYRHYLDNHAEGSNSVDTSAHDFYQSR